MGTDLQLEHIAVNVTDPQGMAKWYGEHLGMTVVRKGDPPDYMHFLADSGGRVVLEIYRALPDEVPDYAAMHPPVLHPAFATQDARARVEKPVPAGARPPEAGRFPPPPGPLSVRPPASPRF